MPRSRYADDEDEEIRPRRASRYEEDDTDDDRPRRRSRYDDADADDDRPARSARDDDDDDDDRGRPRRRSSEDDEEDRPRRSTRAGAQERPKARAVRRGWGAANRIKDADSPFASRLKLSEDPVLVKFLEDEPYVSFRSHWVERKGQKSFTCIADEHPKGCPLCDAGLRAGGRFCFNVVLLNPDDEPIIKSYEVGPRVLDQLKNFNEDPRQGPLSRHYWAISRTGTGGSTATAHQMVKERDLDEWEIEALTEEDLEDFRKRMYDDSIVTHPTRKELLALVDEELDD